MGDLEKADGKDQTEVATSVKSYSLDKETAPLSKGFWVDLRDSFKRADLDGIDTEGMTQEEIQNYLTSKAPLKRSLRAWQISLIAIGGSIGSGLFISVGSVLHSGGAGAVVIGFTAMGFMIFCTMQSLGCLATAMPVNGSYIYYFSRFISRSMGCALAWIYLEGWLVSVPLELISSAITLSYWDSDDNGATRVNKAAWVALFYVVIYVINLFGAAGYGYGEAALSITKIIAVVGFIIFGIVVDCGGYSNTYALSHLSEQSGYLYGLTGKYIGGHFWHNPGSFPHGFKGVANTALSAAFSYGGTEIAALAAAETKDPARAIPKAIKQVFWRVCLFYICSLVLVGCLVPYTDSRLGSTQDGRASPFVIAISNANVKALPSIFNVVICLAVLSVGNAGVFASSRTAASMAAQGYAPRIFGYIDRAGRPLVGIGLSAFFGLLSFMAAYSDYYSVFTWLLAISGLSSLFVWGMINVACVRFYLAMRAQGRSLDELTFKPIGGIVLPIIGAFMNLGMIGLQFWIALFPIGESPNASSFFQTYLSAPIIIVVYIISRIVMKEKHWYIKASNIDLNTGLRNEDPQVLIEENRLEAERIRSRGAIYRFYSFWC